MILPKQDKDGNYYLSYSQIATWKKSKREYIRQYFLGDSFEGNSYTDFGSKVGEALENNDFSSFSLKEQKFLKTIPRYDEFEKEVKLQMGDFYIKGFIDSNNKDCSIIADYKTGNVETKVKDYKSDDYIQLDLYAAAIRQEIGTLPKQAFVYLIDRKGNAFKGEKLKLGNEYITITKELDNDKINEILKDVKNVAKEISEYYKLYLKMSLL